MIHLHVRYRVAAHHVDRFERIFRAVFLPVLREHGFRLVHWWRTLVGPAGEFIEVWAFRDIADYHRKWKALMADPRTAGILEQTGPLVVEEEFRLVEPLPGDAAET